MEAIEPPAGYQSSQSAAETRGSDVPLLTDAPAGGKKNNMMAARWPPRRCRANIYASPAARVGKTAEWMLFLHIDTRLSLVYSDTHVCLGVFSEFILRAPASVLGLADIHAPSFFFAPAQVYSGLARCFFSTESRIERDPKRVKESVCSQSLEN